MTSNPPRNGSPEGKTRPAAKAVPAAKHRPARKAIPAGDDDPAVDDSGQEDAGGALPVDDFASLVLDVVDSIPPGRVMSYGDIAEYLAVGPGPRQVGKVLSVYGGTVPWWRVTHSNGTPAPGHDSRALEQYLAEKTPLRSARPPVRVDMRHARWPGTTERPGLP